MAQIIWISLDLIMSQGNKRQGREQGQDMAHSGAAEICLPSDCHIIPTCQSMIVILADRCQKTIPRPSH